MNNQKPPSPPLENVGVVFLDVLSGAVVSQLSLGPGSMAMLHNDISSTLSCSFPPSVTLKYIFSFFGARQKLLNYACCHYPLSVHLPLPSFSSSTITFSFVALMEI